MSVSSRSELAFHPATLPCVETLLSGRAIALPKSVERAARINITAYELQQEYSLKE